MYNMNKRGLSPLIATILLIALSITIGAIISTFSNNFAQKSSELGDQYTLSNKCQNIDLTISRSFDEEYRVCFNSTNPSLTLVATNSGTINVDGFKVMLADRNFNSYEYEFKNISLLSGKYNTLNFDINSTFASVDDIQEIRLIPYVTNDKNVMVQCPESVIQGLPGSIIGNCE